jgi:hypothetical protein
MLRDEISKVKKEKNYIGKSNRKTCPVPANFQREGKPYWILHTAQVADAL